MVLLSPKLKMWFRSIESYQEFQENQQGYSSLIHLLLLFLHQHDQRCFCSIASPEIRMGDIQPVCFIQESLDLFCYHVQLPLMVKDKFP